LRELLSHKEEDRGRLKYHIEDYLRRKNKNHIVINIHGDTNADGKVNKRRRKNLIDEMIEIEEPQGPYYTRKGNNIRQRNTKIDRHLLHFKREREREMKEIFISR